jgi:hypothetical protein
MTSVVSASLVIVAGQDCDRSLIPALRRMLSGVRVVSCLDEARKLCESHIVDACVVMLPRAVPDEIPAWTPACGAPGHACGVPSLLIADVVTPYIETSARNAGYTAVVPLLRGRSRLYRLISALLQKTRRLESRATS